MKNASAALDELLSLHRRERLIVTHNAAALGQPMPATGAEPRPPGRREAARRAARVSRWQQVRELRDRGVSISQIARELEFDRKTVRRLLATPEPPRNQRQAPPRPDGLNSPTLQPFVGYLQDRWQGGCTNAARLYREVVEQGYTGSYSLLRATLRAWRAPKVRGGAAQRPRRSDRRWLCLRPPSQLTTEERAALGTFLAQEPTIATALRSSSASVRWSRRGT